VTSIKWRGREVEHPVLRALVATWAVLMVILGLILIALTFLVFIPLSIPVHFLLKLCGRRGFVKWDATHTNFSYEIGRDGFRRAP
jgi:hypothetical protein